MVTLTVALTVTLTVTFGSGTVQATWRSGPLRLPLHSDAGDLAKRLPAAALQDSDAFRTKYVYLMQTDAVLSKHLSTLRAIYERYCDVREFPVVGGLDNMRCMSLEEFVNLLDHMGVFEAKQARHVTAV